MRALPLILVSLLLFAWACPAPVDDPPATDGKALVAKYTPFTLTTDTALLSENQKAMIPLLIEAAEAMDEAFWIQAYGDKDALLGSIEDTDLRRFAEINYGPWDRLDDNKPFIEGVGEKPVGANLYPKDATKEELEAAAANDPAIKDLYTVVRRADDGSLKTIPYNEFFAAQIETAAAKIDEAAALADNAALKHYLELRAAAMRSNEYLDSDMAWMDMKDNQLDFVVGPIETYEERIFGAKASFEAYILVKDMEWSKRLAHYVGLLPGLQEGLPVPDEYKKEKPGSKSDLNAYDVVYYAGDCNAGSKTIAINLPNDERVQLEKGARRLQLKNAMRAKFEKILLPITGELLAPEQRGHVTFDAFFANTMFHEVAHGLGIKQTITDKGSVREALGNQASALEEGKADVLGLYMVTKLHEMGELGEADLMDYYVTFVGSIFRSIRFGQASAHGRANMVRFNYFKEQGAFLRDAETGQYRIDFVAMQKAVASLSEMILTIQGNGDYDAAAKLVTDYGTKGAELEADLERLDALGIPRDITFVQGREALGL